MLARALPGARRVLLYLGFRFDDVPKGFDDVLVGMLSKLGALTAYRGFASDSHAFVFDLTQPADGPITLRNVNPHSDPLPQIAGCLNLRPAAVATYLQ